jgi:transcriptional regulator with XRE-family HTH domain
VYSKLESQRKYAGQITAYAVPMETMGDRIRYLRGIKGLSQTDLADRVGVTKSAVSQWELGQSANIKLQTFLKLCEVLGCLPEFLIYGPSRRPPEDSGASGIHRKPNFRKN